MSEMTNSETLERFTEGLKKAASRCRELGRIQRNNDWDKIAISLELMLRNGQALNAQHSLSRGDIIKSVDARVEKKKTVN